MEFLAHYICWYFEKNITEATSVKTNNLISSHMKVLELQLKKRSINIQFQRELVDYTCRYFYCNEIIQTMVSVKKNRCNAHKDTGTSIKKIQASQQCQELKVDICT